MKTSTPCALAMAVVILLPVSAIALDWTQECYPDKDWIFDRAEFGFGDGDETTLLPQGWTTYYFRYSFDAEPLENASTMILEVNYDDAFVAYINGLEVARSANMPEGAADHTTLAQWEHEGGQFEAFDLTWLARNNPWEFVDAYFLNLSVEVHQIAPGDDDVTLAVRLLIDGLPKIHHNSKAFYWPEDSWPAELLTDPITIIHRPLINIPSIVERGQSLAITCGAPPSIVDWSVRLISPYVHLGLDLSSGQYEATTGRWFLQARVPVEAPMGLYDLVVSASEGIEDTTRHSVKVVDHFKDDFYFIHLTDSHIPERGGSTLEFLEEAIAEINIIHPEFVLLSGDYVNRSFKDQIEIGQLYLNEFDVPVFLTSGNHDIGDGMEPWWDYFGWNYLNTYDSTHWTGGPVTQDYSFDYGHLHLVAPMTWVNYIYFQYSIYGYHSMIPSQIAWLHDDLSSVEGNPFIVMFYHYDFGWYDDAPQMPQFFNQYGVDLALWGHTHEAAEYQDGPTLSLNTAALMNAWGGFRLLKFQDGLLSVHPHLWNADDITLAYQSPNDGTSTTNTATIVNTHDQDFEQALVRFLMPAPGPYQVNGGTILQVVDGGHRLIYEVQVDVPGNGQATVSIGPQTKTDDAPAMAVPEDPAMLQNSPNPFNSSTRISFQLQGDVAEQIRLRIFNVRGQEVTTLADHGVMSGNHSVVWDGRDDRGHPVASGLYFCRFETSGQAETIRMVLLR